MRVHANTKCLCEHRAADHLPVNRGTHIGRGKCQGTRIRNLALVPCECEQFRPSPGQPKPLGSRKPPHGINRYPSRHLG